MDLNEYLEQYDRVKKARRIAGPVITISREFGCEGAIFGEKLTEALSKASLAFRANKVLPWKFLSKEIFRQAAKELHLNAYQVEQTLRPRQKSLLENFADGFSRQPIYEPKIHKTLKDVITSYAHRGRVVILGRAGVAITREIPNSLHIRLVAPFNWRMKKISELKNISEKEAESLTLENDHQRKLFIQNMRNSKYDEGLFDITLNRMTMNVDEMVAAVLKVVQLRKIL